MKIVLSSRGSRGDVNPIIEVAALLKEAGHEVVVCVPKIFEEHCIALNLNTLIYPEDSRAVMQNMGSGLGSLKGAFAFFSNSVDDQFNYMLDASADADVLVTTINEIAAPTIAEYHGIPHFRVSFSPVLPGKQAPPFMPWQNMSPFFNKLGWKGMNSFSKKVIKKFVNPRRLELGLGAVTDSNYYHTGNSHTILAINPELAPPCISWGTKYKYDYTGYCYGHIDGELDKDLQEFIDAGVPPVYIGFGSVQIDNPEAFTEMIVKAVDEAGCRVIVGKGWTGLGNEKLGNNMFIVKESNHGTLFPKLAGIVHHGGSGTTHTAARAGIPQFIMPQFYDQYYWGNSIYKNGLGPKPVPPKKISLKKMVAALKEMTNGTYKATALDLSRKMQEEDGVQKITDIILTEVKPKAHTPVKTMQPEIKTKSVTY